MYNLGFKVFTFPTPYSPRIKKNTSHHEVTWDYLCATGNYNRAAMQQSASSQGVPASLSDSSFPLAASRKIETVYEKWKEGGKCHLSSVAPPGVWPCSRASSSRTKTPKLSSGLPTEHSWVCM